MRTQPSVADVVCRIRALSVVIGILFVIGCGGGGTKSSSSAPITYTIGGTIAGISGTGLELQDNGGNNLPASANGSFTFTTAIASGGSYNVTVLTQPSSPAQTCGVTNGSGTASANVASVQITCTTTATLQSIAVTPTNPTIAKSTSEQFAVTGTYSDNPAQDITTTVIWSSGTTSVATVSNAAGSNGLLTAVAVGTSMITATSGSVSGQTTLTVPVTYSISGIVTISGGTTPLAGVVLSLANAAMATTDANGNYLFSGLSNGSYTVTPALAGREVLVAGAAVRAVPVVAHPARQVLREAAAAAAASSALAQVARTGGYRSTGSRANQRRGCISG